MHTQYFSDYRFTMDLKGSQDTNYLLLYLLNHVLYSVLYNIHCTLGWFQEKNSLSQGANERVLLTDFKSVFNFSQFKILAITFFKAVLLRYQTSKSIFFRFFSPKGTPFGFWKLWSKMRNYTKVSGKKQKQIWNQWAKLFHLPPVNVF